MNVLSSENFYMVFAINHFFDMNIKSFSFYIIQLLSRAVYRYSGRLDHIRNDYSVLVCPGADLTLIR